MRLKTVIRNVVWGVAIAGLTLSASPSLAQLSPAQLKAQRDRAARDAAARAQAERQRGATSRAVRVRVKTAHPKKYLPPILSLSHLNLTKPSWWIFRSSDKSRWCRYNDFDSVQRDVNREIIDSYMQVSLSYKNDNLEHVGIVYITEDSLVEDTYIFDSHMNVIKIFRGGHYIENPYAQVVFEKGPSGNIEITAGSRVIIRRMEAAGYETYPFSQEDRPTYASLQSMPFWDLIGLSKNANSVTTCKSSG